MKKYRIVSNFEDLIGQRRMSTSGFCRDYDFPFGTLRAALRPGEHPDRVGYVQARTAYRLARAWAAATQQSEEAAYQEIIIEEEKSEQT